MPEAKPQLPNSVAQWFVIPCVAPKLPRRHLNPENTGKEIKCPTSQDGNELCAVAGVLTGDTLSLMPIPPSGPAAAEARATRLPNHAGPCYLIGADSAISRKKSSQ